MRQRLASHVLEKGMYKKTLWVLAVLAMSSAAACTLDNPEAPELAGPSTLGHSIEVQANPDQLTADGFSSSIIEAILRGPNSERITGATIHFDIAGFVDLGNLAPLNGPRPGTQGVEGVAVQATTDGSGVARARYWAPFRTDQPDDTTVTILAREAGTNFRQALQAAGQTDIFLRAADRPFPSPFPTPQPGCTAPRAALSFSQVCPGGEILRDRQMFALGGESEAGEDGTVIETYVFNWGDGTSTTTGDSTASHIYAVAGRSVSIQLTVINSCGASGSITESVEVVAVCP